MSDTPLTSNNEAPATKKPADRGWIWFLVVVGILGGAAGTISMVYNLRQQLSLEKFQAAQKRWEEKGPKDYLMEYTKQGNVSGTFRVVVRGGKVESATMRPVGAPEDQARPLEERLFIYHNMPALMSDIEDFLLMDQKPDAPRPYNRGIFDPEDGHVIQYVRSVAAAKFRLEIRVLKLERLPPAE